MAQLIRQPARPIPLTAVRREGVRGRTDCQSVLRLAPQITHQSKVDGTRAVSGAAADHAVPQTAGRTGQDDLADRAAGRKRTRFVNDRLLCDPHQGVRRGDKQGLAVWARDEGTVRAEFERFTLWRLPEDG
jgi:hypothetical protein